MQADRQTDRQEETTKLNTISTEDIQNAKHNSRGETESKKPKSWMTRRTREQNTERRQKQKNGRQTEIQRERRHRRPNKPKGKQRYIAHEERQKGRTGTRKNNITKTETKKERTEGR